MKDVKVKESNVTVGKVISLYKRQAQVTTRYKVSLRGLRQNLRETVIDVTSDVTVLKNRIWFTSDSKYFFLILVGTDKRHEGPRAKERQENIKQAELHLKRKLTEEEQQQIPEEQYNMRLWKSLTFDAETLTHQPHMDIDFYPSQINCKASSFPLMFVQPKKWSINLS